MKIDSAARRFALEVVKQLREHGFEALWAGGCVRDYLLGMEPKDYDVATSATPEQVRSVFGRRRTIAIGASFGVITVLGPRDAGQIEVATFRQDAAYSDGRHPDQVTFSSAKEDAQRRDFTINGLFWDPVDEHVIDYVDGQQDLEAGIVCAIGDPHQRFDEDKLRMLRAVRFAAVYDFQLAADTRDAIQSRAGEISVVSAERISDEFRRMLQHPRRRRAAELALATGLLPVVLPELQFASPTDGQANAMLSMLQSIRLPSFPPAFAVMLRATDAAVNPAVAAAICQRWKLSKNESTTILACLAHERLLLEAPSRSWAELQPTLIHPKVDQLLAYSEAVAEVLHGSNEAIEFCRKKLTLPPDQLNPAPLLTGDDLQAAGFAAGPAYRHVLQAVRDAQLLGEVCDKMSALTLAKKLWSSAQ